LFIYILCYKRLPGEEIDAVNFDPKYIIYLSKIQEENMSGD